MSSSSTPTTTPRSGFKKCKLCGSKMSITDLHRECLCCPGEGHDMEACSKCQAMAGKALQERRRKLQVGRKDRKASSVESRPHGEKSPRRERHRSRPRSDSHCSSSSSKKSKKRCHRSPSTSSSDESQKMKCPTKHSSSEEWEAFRVKMMEVFEKAKPRSVTSSEAGQERHRSDTRAPSSPGDCKRKDREPSRMPSEKGSSRVDRSRSPPPFRDLSHLEGETVEGRLNALEVDPVDDHNVMDAVNAVINIDAETLGAKGSNQARAARK